MKIDPNNLDERKNYKLLSSIVIPRPIAFITSLNDDLSLNGAPFSFFNVVSGKPPLISVSILRKNGQMKDTSRNILNYKEFVVHLTTLENIEKVNLSAKEYMRNQSEIEELNFTTIESSNLKTPGVKDFKIRLEVKLIKHLTFKDNNIVAVDFFIGKVIMYHLTEDILLNNYIDYKKLQPVGRLAGNNYLTSSGFKKIIRPK